MGISDLILGQQQQLQPPPELGQNIANVQSNISQLLSRANQGPSTYDLGHSLLMSAAYGGQVPYTQFLQQGQDRQYQAVANQANLVDKSVEMYATAAKMKAQSNPMAALIDNTYESLKTKDPVWANRYMNYLIQHKDQATPEMSQQAVESTRPAEPPKVIGYDTPGGPTGTQHVDELWDPHPTGTGPLNTFITSKQTPGTNVVINNLPAMEASRVASQAVAEKQMGTVQSQIDSNPGLGDRFQMALGKIGVPGHWKDLYRQMEAAIATKIYADTGAAARPDEVDAKMSQYAPGPTDPPETMQHKMNEFQAWVGTSLDLAKGGAEARKGAAKRLDQGGGAPILRYNPETGKIE